MGAMFAYASINVYLYESTKWTEKDTVAIIMMILMVLYLFFIGIKRLIYGKDSVQVSVLFEDHIFLIFNLFGIIFVPLGVLVLTHALVTHYIL